MNRRGFLRGLIGGTAAAVVAPAALAELLAPKRTIFLPPRGGWYRHPAEVFAQSVMDIQTAIGVELDKLLSAHAPIYYNEAGLEMIEARVHAALRKVGETDAELRERIFTHASDRIVLVPVVKTW